VDLSRILINTHATLSHTFSVDEVPTDAAGAVTWTTTRWDGTPVASGTATHPGPLGQYTAVVNAGAVLDLWYVDWTGSVGGGTVIVRDIVEIVGGFIFTIAALRKAHKTIRDPSRYPTADLVRLRTQVEMEAEDIGGRAFVPRWGRYKLTGTWDQYLLLPFMPIRKVRAVVVNGIPYSQAMVDAIEPAESGVMYRPGGWPGWAYDNMIIECEHGLDMPSFVVTDAAITRARQLLTNNTTAIPGNATSWTTQDGGIYRVSAAGVRSTGYSDIDAAYLRGGYDGPV
jgi:hypothetical protein